MYLRPLTFALALALSTGLAACQPQTTNETTAPATTQAPADEAGDIAAKVAAYEEVALTADLSHLAEGDRQAIVHLLEASEIMDALFWKQAYGDREALLAEIEDPATRRFVEINYGPWDRLDDNAPFVAGVGPRPPGANFYPADMTKAEFEAADLPGKDGLYTLVRRNDAGELAQVKRDLRDAMRRADRAEAAAASNKAIARNLATTVHGATRRERERRAEAARAAEARAARARALRYDALEEPFLGL